MADSDTTRPRTTSAPAHEVDPRASAPSVPSLPPLPGLVHAFFADEVAMSKARESAARAIDHHCDACETLIDDEHDMNGSGLYVWSRGDELRIEEPLLCASCATAGSMIRCSSPPSWPLSPA